MSSVLGKGGYAATYLVEDMRLAGKRRRCSRNWTGDAHRPRVREAIGHAHESEEPGR